MYALFTNYTFQIVALGSALLGITSGVLGTFAVLRKQSLLGDGVSHAALPGVALAFLIFGSKDTSVLLTGALFSGVLATLLIIGIVRNSRIKFDSALAFVMSVFFGLGLVLLTYVQKIPNSNQAGLNRFIFGQASTLLKSDLEIMAISGVILLVLVIAFWKEFKLLSFDSDFAHTIGFEPKKLNFLLSLMIVVSIIIGLQTVGVILMSAMLIAPAVAARQWTNKLGIMVVLSAIFGAASGIIGTAISSMVSKLPTGPVIVVCMSTIVLISVLFAPNRGIIHRLYLRKISKKTLLKGGTHHVSSI